MKWRRPYSGGPFRWLYQMMAVVGAAALIGAAVSLARGSKDVGLAATVLFAIGWAIWWWRFVRMGVYVSQEGIRVNGPIRTRTIPWKKVAGIRIAPMQPPSPFDRVPIAPGTEAIWIDQRDGPPLQTPLFNRSAEFLGRRGALGRAFASLKSELDHVHSGESS